MEGTGKMTTKLAKADSDGQMAMFIKGSRKDDIKHGRGLFKPADGGIFSVFVGDWNGDDVKKCWFCWY